MLDLSARLSTGTSDRLRILDIGPRFEVDLLHRLLPAATVDTLGINAGPFEIALPWLGSLLMPGGHLLIQTPNAVALPKRLSMLLGTHPFTSARRSNRLFGRLERIVPATLRAGITVIYLRPASA